MSEATSKAPSFEDIRTEFLGKLTDATTEYQLERGEHPVHLINKMAPVIADVYCTLSKEAQREGTQRYEIDHIVSNILKNRWLVQSFSEPDDTEHSKFQLELYKQVAFLLAERLGQKPDDEASVISETRERLQ